jgi:23S rRNA (cytidine1920-2'-O)/16S rRNA (cytidine1409-2'-O)-methyltransferase
MKPGSQRIDVALVERGLFPSREKAQRAIMAGDVFLGERVIDKPGTVVPSDADLRVRESKRFVSRGGFKLLAALEHFGVDPTGKRCMDIGASTGGFTDCLLQHGAAHVLAIDVGHGQLDWKIRSDPRVTVLEKVNARTLSRAEVPDPIDLCVVDVSFISLRLILPAIFPLLHAEGVILTLIKPQFEVGREEVGKGGIVRDPALHEAAIASIRNCVDGLGKKWEGVIESPILGTEGNKEFLACLRV